MSRKKIFIGLITIINIALIVLGLVLLFLDQMVTAIVLLALVFVLLVALVICYNRMVRCKNKVKESLALIDIHLKLRFDLVPNLVKVVKGYAEHEKELFASIAKIRKSLENASTEEEKLECNNQLVPRLKHLTAVAESYPELKTNALYKSLMDQLGEIEDRIVASRRIYDSNVNIYNTLVQVFPMNVLAYMFEFESEKLFKIDT